MPAVGNLILFQKMTTYFRKLVKILQIYGQNWTLHFRNSVQEKVAEKLAPGIYLT